MELNDYQGLAMSTCMKTSDNFAYMMLNLVGEVGEFASKVAKAIRKGEASIGEIDGKKSDMIYHIADNDDETMYAEWEKRREELEKEAGDILWQLSGLCTVMGWTLEEVAEMNLSKLQARKKAGTIDGNGDGICGEDRK